MKIVIIEDNLRHWEYIKSMLTNLNIEFYPTVENDFKEIKRKITQSFSPKREVKHSAESFLNEVFKKGDFLLLDYELHTSIEAVNCIEVYLKYNLNHNALIFTYLDEIKCNEIKIELKEKGLNHKIEVFQKPNNFANAYNLPNVYGEFGKQISTANKDIQNNDFAKSEL